MKKFLLTICAAALLFTGCGGDQQLADRPATNFSGKAVQLGMIAPLNADEQKMDTILASIEEKTGIKNLHNHPKFYDSLKTMQMGLDAGTIEEISLYRSVAEYIIATNDKYEIVPDNALEKIAYSFCFAVRAKDSALKADLDKVGDEMAADGTLDKLINEYITNVNKVGEPPKVEIPKIEGAETLKVGITGDLPPLDLILPDNSPAGFNTAMLAEIAKRLNRNIEPVQIESGARAAALNANLIDVVFWAIVPISEIVPADIDKPEGLELSKPYFKDNVVHIKLKNAK